MPRVSKKAQMELKIERTERTERRVSPAFIAGLFVVTVVVIGGSVYLGRSDTGAINVSATINDANQVAAQNGGEQVTTTNQAFQNLPNGGLVPLKNQDVSTPTPEPEPTETTSTTTDTTATSTQEEGVTGDDTTDTADVEESVSTPPAQPDEAGAPQQ